MHDLRYALRTLVSSPGFAVTAVVTLALGIGASTAMFSVAYGVSVRPLPYPHPDRLVRIHESNPANRQLEHEVSIGTFHEWRQRVPSLESIALYSKGAGVRFLAGSDAPPVRTQSVSPAFFDVLGVRPMLGPGFKSEREYTRFSADDDAVLSFAAWQRLFGGRADVIGATLEFSGVGDNDVYRVVGVMPKDFVFDEPVDLWRPTLIVEQPVSRLLRLWRYDRVVARLKPGATIDQARRELEGVSARLAQEFPQTNAGWTATIETLHAAAIGSFGRATWLLLASVAVVLLVTCLNVGGLLAARAVARERETLVRVALGAESWRLLRLWLAESSAIGGLGAAAGVLLAWAGVAALKAAAPPGIPRLEAVALDGPALMVAAVSTLVAVLAFTIAPRRRTGTLRPALPGRGRTPRAARIALTVAQCAGAATLVVLAVMLARSFVRLTSIDLGWDADGVLSMHVSPPMPRELRRPWARYVEWSDRLVARLEATPGIERAAITSMVPLSGQTHAATLARGRGKAAGDAGRWPGLSHVVSDGYFDMMGIRRIHGRLFDARDRFTAPQLIDSRLRPDHGAVVVSETTARTLWPDRSALGQGMWLPDIDTVRWRQVVGVVEDIQFSAVGEAPALHVFVPWTQAPTGVPRLLVKGSTSAAAIADVVKAVVQDVEPGTRIDQIAALDDLFLRATAQPRFTTRLVAAFGSFALLLAAVGIYGTLSYLVSARTREIGIRLALGAAPAAIMSSVLRRGLIPAVVGGVVGLATALAIARVFRSLFFDLAALDVASAALGGTLLLIVAIVAAIVPARRASRVDPAIALRAE